MARLFSQNVETCGADDTSAIGAAIDVGGSFFRPPIAVARVVEKIAEGATAKLNDGELAALATLGITVTQRADGRHRAEAPIKMAAYFRPIAK